MCMSSMSIRSSIDSSTRATSGTAFEEQEHLVYERGVMLIYDTTNKQGYEAFERHTGMYQVFWETFLVLASKALS